MPRGIVRRFWWLPAVFAFGAAAGLYMYGIGEWSLWFDEAFSAALIQVPPRELIELTAVDVHPPLYYLLLKGWAALFGDTETALRSFSALAMLGAMAFGFGIVRRYFGTKTAYLVLPFLLLAPFLLRYAQEARMYALAALICTAATYVLLRAEESKARVWAWWSLYSLLVVAGLYVHYYTAFIWIAHWAWHWYTVRHTPGRRFFDVHWLGAYGAAAALFLPWMPTFLSQADAVQDGFWIGPVSQESLINVASNVLLYTPEADLKNWLSLAFMLVVGGLAALMYSVYKTLVGRQRQCFALLVMMGFVPVIALFLVSLPPLQPLFVERYLVPSALAMYLLIGVGIALGLQTKRRLLKGLLAAVTLVLMIIGIVNVFRVDGQHAQSPAKTMTAVLESRLSDNGAIVATSPYSFYEYDYYGTDNRVYFVDPGKTVGVIGSTKALEGSSHLVENLADFGVEKDEVWLVGPVGINIEVPASWQEIDVIAMPGGKAVGYRTGSR